jgi:hypothetical protein
VLPSTQAIKTEIFDRRNGEQSSICTAEILSRPCLLRVKSGHDGANLRCLLYPRKQTSSFYEHTDFRPSLISIATVTKHPAKWLVFHTSRPPKADIAEYDWDVRFVPLTDISMLLSSR